MDIYPFTKKVTKFLCVQKYGGHKIKVTYSCGHTNVAIMFGRLAGKVNGKKIVHRTEKVYETS
jgi:hypothetical protein